MTAPSLGPPTEPGAGEPAWAWWMAPAALALAFTGAVVLGAVVSGIAIAAGADLTGTGKGPVSVVLLIVQDASFIGAPLFLAGVVAHRLRPGDFGLRGTRIGPAIGWAALAFIAYYAFALVWNEVSGHQRQEDLFRSLGFSHDTVAVVLIAILVCVVAPLAEEFLFRGFCFGALRPTLGVVGAAIAVGAVFGAIHIGSTPAILLPTLAVLGFLLCLLRWK